MMSIDARQCVLIAHYSSKMATAPNEPSPTTHPRPWMPRCVAAVAFLGLAVTTHLWLQRWSDDDQGRGGVIPEDLAASNRVGSWGMKNNDGQGEVEVLDGDSSHLLGDATDDFEQGQLEDRTGATIEAAANNATEQNKINHQFIHKDIDGSSWIESHTPRDQSISKRDIRISFRLHNTNDVPHPHKFLSVHGYKCGAVLLDNTANMFDFTDFTTTISTDLNILFIGDSISQQFTQGFYSSVLGEEHVGSHVIVRSFINGQDIRYTNSGLHVCSSFVAPTRGGGVSAYWRVLELMSNQTESKAYVNCKNQKGWVAQNGKKLSMYRYFYPNSGKNDFVKVNTTKNNRATAWYRTHVEYNESTKQSYRVGGFDCCVVRPQHGWMELREITRERIVEQIELCNTVVGAQTVIITTLPLNNNVLTPSDWEGVIAINDIIRDIARNWQPPSSEEDGVKWVLVQEFGNFTNQILWRNAQHIGYNITMPDFTKKDGWESRGSDFLLHRYRGIKSMKHAPSIPMVCAYPIEQPFSTKNKTVGQCFFNRISRDGFHWCVETLGPRYSASIACLLGCVYNGKEPESNEKLRGCEQECNDQFMSLIPVDESWVGTNTTIFSTTNDH